MWWMNLSSETAEPLVFLCALRIETGGVLDKLYVFPADES